MNTARILDWRRGHPRAEFVPKLRVESFHRSDSEGCTIVIIERHSPDRFSTGPLYICALYAHAGWPPPESSCSIEPITACLLHQEPPRLGSRLEFWRTTGLRDNFGTFEKWESAAFSGVSDISNNVGPVKSFF